MNLSKFFTGIGLICIILAGILFWQRNNPNRLAFVEIPITKKQNIAKKNLPVRIIIKDVGIDLPVYPAKIKEGNWETTTRGASWLDFSPIPGEKGNSILYGHNWTNILGKLIKIKPGKKIQIILRDGSEQTFLVESAAVISPKNVSVLKQTEDKRITLYTCVGIFDQKRFVVVARM